jgi:ABC-type microcin C transport system permease subunit YejB
MAMFGNNSDIMGALMQRMQSQGGMTPEAQAAMMQQMQGQQMPMQGQQMPVQGQQMPNPEAMAGLMQRLMQQMQGQQMPVDSMTSDLMQQASAQGMGPQMIERFRRSYGRDPVNIQELQMMS